MHASRAALALAVLLAACDGDARSTTDDVGAARAAPDSAADTLLTPEGWGALRIGLTRAEVERVAGRDAHPERVGGVEPEVCDEFRPVGVPEGMLLMIERDTLTRITIMRDSDVRTERGFGVGDAASEILEAYGAAAGSSPHKYRDAPSAYITAWSVPPDGPSPARGIVYDIGNDGLVSLIHAGGESITYVEGCL